MKSTIFAALVASVSAGCDECLEAGTCAKAYKTETMATEAPVPQEGEPVQCPADASDPICNSTSEDGTTTWLCFSGELLEDVIEAES